MSWSYIPSKRHSTYGCGCNLEMELREVCCQTSEMPEFCSWLKQFLHLQQEHPCRMDRRNNWDIWVGSRMDFCFSVWWFRDSSVVGVQELHSTCPCCLWGWKLSCRMIPWCHEPSEFGALHLSWWIQRWSGTRCLGSPRMRWRISSRRRQVLLLLPGLWGDRLPTWRISVQRGRSRICSGLVIQAGSPWT